MADKNHEVNRLQEQIFALKNKNFLDQDKEETAAGYKNNAHDLRRRLQNAIKEREDMKREYNSALTGIGNKDQQIRDQEDEIDRLKREIERIRKLLRDRDRELDNQQVRGGYVDPEQLRQLEDANDRIAHLNMLITKKNNECDARKGIVKDKNAYIAELRERLRILKAAKARELSPKARDPSPPPKLPVAPREKFDCSPRDDIDQMLTDYLRRAGSEVPIKRLGDGYYLFGTRKIYAKIINGKLVVRVGGGYMNIEEFVATYSDHELARLKTLMDKEGVDWYEDLSIYRANSGEGMGYRGSVRCKY